MSMDTRTVKTAILAPVFIPAVIVALLLVIGTISNPELANEAFQATLAYITRTFGWFYMLAVAIFLVFIVAMAASRRGKIKLGPDHAVPLFCCQAMFAMQFTARYGTALLIFGVVVPIFRYAPTPVLSALSVVSAKQAMQIAFFHWCCHTWAIYVLVGLASAYRA